MEGLQKTDNLFEIAMGLTLTSLKSIRITLFGKPETKALKYDKL